MRPSEGSTRVFHRWGVFAALEFDRRSAGHGLFAASVYANARDRPFRYRTKVVVARQVNHLDKSAASSELPSAPSATRMSPSLSGWVPCRAISASADNPERVRGLGHHRAAVLVAVCPQCPGRPLRSRRAAADGAAPCPRSPAASSGGAPRSWPPNRRRPPPRSGRPPARWRRIAHACAYRDLPSGRKALPVRVPVRTHPEPPATSAHRQGSAVATPSTRAFPAIRAGRRP